MNYYGPPNRIRWCSYYQALDPGLVPDDFFAGKAVFVGARMLTRFSGERKDEYRNPFSFWLSKEMAREQEALYMAGVEVQATAFLNLARADWLRRWSPASRTVGDRALRNSRLAALAQVPSCCRSSGGHRGSRLGGPGLLPTVPQPVHLVPLAHCRSSDRGGSRVVGSVQLGPAIRAKTALYEHTLGLYLSPKLVKVFASKPAMLQPGAEKQVLTFFFSDIADFTSISEGMDSDELAALMNAYFQTAVGECVHATDGTVVKYIGDSIFAFWNAPGQQPDHAALACEAALRLRGLANKPVCGRLLHTRIGLHTGAANVGNFGSTDRVDYTALGENVNLASRLEGLNKYLGTRCLISAATRAEIGDRFVTRNLGQFRLKGFEKPIEVHELMGRLQDAGATTEAREVFARALKNFEARNLEFAGLDFRQAIALLGEDGPSAFYLQRIKELSEESLKENWDTFTVLKEK